MQRTDVIKRTAHLLLSVSLVSGLLIPTTAFADEKGKGAGATKPAQSQQAQSQAPKQEEKKEAPKPQAASQTSSRQPASAPKNEDKGSPAAETQPQAQVKTSSESAHKPVEFKPDDHPSGKDRSVEPGGSGTQGRSMSDPDGMSNGGTDKPELASQRSAPWNQDADNDGNNGCGNDDDFEDDNNGWCGKDKVRSNPPTTGGSKNGGDEGGPTAKNVHVVGCFVWKDSTDKPFFINEHMTDEQAKQFEKSTNFVSSSMDGCKKQEVAGTVELSGCYFNPATGQYVYFDAQTFATETERDAKVQGLVAQTMDRAHCKPQVLGTQDNNPNPGGPSDSKSESVTMYGCFLRADGTYAHENRTFGSQSEMDAFKASQSYVGVDASRPNPDQCTTPERSANPPAEVAGIQTENPAPMLMTTIAVADRAPESVNPLVVPAVEQERPIGVITTTEMRESLPALDVPAREGVQALVSEAPAPAAPRVVSQQQPVARQTAGVLPSTGEPLVDMALLSLGFLGLTLLGLRFLRAGVRRA